MRHPLPAAAHREESYSRERQLKGGWTTVGELVRQNILTEEEAARLAPLSPIRIAERPRKRCGLPRRGPLKCKSEYID